MSPAVESRYSRANLLQCALHACAAAGHGWTLAGPGEGSAPTSCLISKAITTVVVTNMCPWQVANSPPAMRPVQLARDVDRRLCLTQRRDENVRSAGLDAAKLIDTNSSATRPHPRLMRCQGHRTGHAGLPKA